jgi:hypothetical protein
MTTYQCAFKATGNTAVVTMQRAADTLPAGATDIGDVIHDVEPDNLSGQTTFNDSHVLYQHVQELCYKHGWTDMANVTINWDVVGVEITNGATGTVTAAAGANHTLQLYARTLPEEATSEDIVWTSGTPAKATVNSTGLVTGVAAGSTVITAKSSVDNAALDTITITVT